MFDGTITAAERVLHRRIASHEVTDGVLVITGVLCIALTGLGALSFYGPGETDFVPSVLGDLDFMPVHEG